MRSVVERGEKTLRAIPPPPVDLKWRKNAAVVDETKTPPHRLAS